jgi:outer membrane protein assembly factor BamB
MKFWHLKAGVLLLALVMAASLGANAADWPQTQGPDRTGASPETGVARAWPADGPKVLWEFPLGKGYAGAAVVGDEVFVLDRVDDKQDVLRCIDLSTGKERWNFAYDAPGSAGNNGSRTTPTVDENFVYTVGLMGDFYCVDRKTRQLAWHKNIGAVHGVGKPPWGFSQAPVLYKNLVIIAPQAQDAFVVAYDKITGEVVWESKTLGKLGYCVPSVENIDGVDQVLMIGASAQNKEMSPPGMVGGLSPADGKILWTYNSWTCWIPIAIPLLLPDDRLFMTGGYEAGSTLIEVKQKEGAWTVKEIKKFTMEECGSQIQQPLYVDGHLYVNSNSNERQDGLRCFTLDGELLWSSIDTEGAPHFEKGGMISVDGLILNLEGDNGALHLIQPSTEGYKELAQAKICSGKQIWSAMAFSQGKLVLRDLKTMRCVDLVNP